jgi:hypothetical protein
MTEGFQSVGHNEFRALRPPTKPPANGESLPVTEQIDLADPGSTVTLDTSALNSTQPIEIGSNPETQNAWSGDFHKDVQSFDRGEILRYMAQAEAERQRQAEVAQAARFQEEVRIEIEKQKRETVRRENRNGPLWNKLWGEKEVGKDQKYIASEDIPQMKQGQGGDCYAICALRGVKENAEAMDVILENITDHGDGNYTVKFFDDTIPPDGKWVDIQVSEKDIGDGPRQPMQGTFGDRLVERAYHSFISRQRTGEIGHTQALQKVEVKGKETFLEKILKKFGKQPSKKYEEKLVWEGGFPQKALSHMLGPEYQKYNAQGEQKMAEALQDIFVDRQSGSHDIIATIYTGGHFPEPSITNKLKPWEKTTPNDIFPRHAYTLGKIDYNAGIVQVINPHNTKNEKIVLPFDQLFKYFTNIAYVQKQKEGSSAINQTIFS